MTKRLFVALELPEICRQTLANLGPPIRGVRWLPPENLHLTLAFLDDVEPQAEHQLREQLATVYTPPFHLPIQGVGTFGKQRPSVVWVGVGSGHPHLFALHKHVHDALLAAGFDPELRPFKPHITIGRVKNVAAETLRPFLREHEESEFCLFKVTGFALISSHRSPCGTYYRVEMRREFDADAGA